MSNLKFCAGMLKFAVLCKTVNDLHSLAISGIICIPEEPVPNTTIFCDLKFTLYDGHKAV